MNLCLLESKRPNRLVWFGTACLLEINRTLSGTCFGPPRGLIGFGGTNDDTVCWKEGGAGVLFNLFARLVPEQTSFARVSLWCSWRKSQLASDRASTNGVVVCIPRNKQTTWWSTDVARSLQPEQPVFVCSPAINRSSCSSGEIKSATA